MQPWIAALLGAIHHGEAIRPAWLYGHSKPTARPLPCCPRLQIGVTQYKRTGNWEAHIWQVRFPEAKGTLSSMGIRMLVHQAGGGGGADISACSPSSCRPQLFLVFNLFSLEGGQNKGRHRPGCQ